MTNPYCQVLGITVPTLESVKDHTEASTYTLLIVALLEHGAPMTLAEVAKRFERAGIAPAESAVRSLSRCRPARSPVYRDGDQYSLDPYDDETDLWAFRLGLRGPKFPRLTIAKPQAAPDVLPGLDQPLTVAELDEAWTHTSLHNWSSQRLAVCVLDAHDGGPLTPNEVISFVHQWSSSVRLKPGSASRWHRKSAVQVRDDGSWEMAQGHDAVTSARNEVRGRIERIRQMQHVPPDPREMAAHTRRCERKRQLHADELAAMSRVLAYAWPSADPQAIVLIDVNLRQIQTHFADDFDTVRLRIDAYDIVAAESVRGLLRMLGMDSGVRRLAELGPSQQTIKSGSYGRPLKITTELLVRSSCDIDRPFVSDAQLHKLARAGERDALTERLESNAKSMFALYQYGRLHRWVRVRWRSLDEAITAPWVHRDEDGLHRIIRGAYEAGAAVDAVIGRSPDWDDPWAGARECRVHQFDEYDLRLVADNVFVVFDWDVQAVRVRGGADGAAL
jgi:hypothetical protein